MFCHWEINHVRLASRDSSSDQLTVPEATLLQHVREREFPDRRLWKKTPEIDRVAFQAKCDGLRLHATEQQRLNPVFFATGNSWTDTLRADKQHNLEHTTRSMTSRPPSLLRISSLGVSFLHLVGSSVPIALWHRFMICSVLLLRFGDLFARLLWSCPPPGPLTLFVFGAVLSLPSGCLWSSRWFPSCCGSSVLCCCVGGSACVLLLSSPWPFPSPLRLVPCGVLAQFCAGPSLWVSGCFM